MVLMLMFSYLHKLTNRIAPSNGQGKKQAIFTLIPTQIRTSKQIKTFTFLTLYNCWFWLMLMLSFCISRFGIFEIHNEEIFVHKTIINQFRNASMVFLLLLFPSVLLFISCAQRTVHKKPMKNVERTIEVQEISILFAINFISLALFRASFSHMNLENRVI